MAMCLFCVSVQPKTTWEKIELDPTLTDRSIFTKNKSGLKEKDWVCTILVKDTLSEVAVFTGVKANLLCSRPYDNKNKAEFSMSPIYITSNEDLIYSGERLGSYEYAKNKKATVLYFKSGKEQAECYFSSPKGDYSFANRTGEKCDAFIKDGTLSK